MKTPIEILLDNLDYTPTNAEPNKEGLPYVTHEGKLQLGDITISVLVLSTGQRIIPKEEIERLFGKDIQLNKTP